MYIHVLVPPREQLFSLRHTDETAATKYLVREETTHTLILPSKGDKGTNTYHSMHTPHTHAPGLATIPLGAQQSDFFIFRHFCASMTL